MSRTTDGFRAVRARRHAVKHHNDHARQVRMLRALLAQGNHQGETLHTYGASATVLASAVDLRLNLLETEVARLAGHHPKPVDWSTADLSGLGKRR